MIDWECPYNSRNIAQRQVLVESYIFVPPSSTNCDDRQAARFSFNHQSHHLHSLNYDVTLSHLFQWGLLGLPPSLSPPRSISDTPAHMNLQVVIRKTERGKFL